MRISHILVFALVFVLPVLSINPPAQAGTKAVKDWTFLVYLNGDNSLDSFGPMDLNEMEKVGSTDQVNVVVQWASTENGESRRLYIQKDTDSNTVTSPVVDHPGKVDMGDWHSLVQFIEWGVKNYPAKHYFVDVWDHGGGWHIQSTLGIRDISWDDTTGNYMTTEQLGQALAEASAYIGHKIDVYGSDACLMAMAEVAGELSGSVQTMVGSEEVEPGDGWPYDGLLTRWTANPSATGQDVAKILVEEYVKSYEGGTQGTQEATMSAFDLSKMGQLEDAVRDFGGELAQLDKDGRAKAISAMSSTQKFTYNDYGDLSDYLTQLQASGVKVRADGLQQAISAFVIANGVTSGYAKAKGLSIWLPGDQSAYASYSGRYEGLQFGQSSKWGDTLASLLQNPPGSFVLGQL